MPAPPRSATTFTFLGSNPLSFGTGAVALTAGVTITVNSNTLTFGGAVSGTDSLTMAGNGTLVLGSAANTFGSASTGLAISAGTVQLAPGANISTANTNGVLLTVNGGVLDLNGNSSTQVGNFTGSGGTVLNSNAGTATLVVGGNSGRQHFRRHDCR